MGKAMLKSENFSEKKKRWGWLEESLLIPRWQDYSSAVMFIPYPVVFFIFAQSSNYSSLQDSWIAERFYVVRCWEREGREITLLGIGRISLRNRTLLRKWLWRFLRESDALWNKVILGIFQTLMDGMSTILLGG